jgi:hypothetical protein
MITKPHTEPLESLKATLRRIYELSERGVGGERDSAKATLTRLLKKHGLTLPDLLSPRTEAVYFEWKHEWERKLLVQVICKVKNVRSYYSQKVEGKRKACTIELTTLEAIDARLYYDHYRLILATQLDEFATAFFHANHLYCDVQDETERAPLTPEERTRLAQLAQLVQAIEPAPSPRRRLEGQS